MPHHGKIVDVSKNYSRRLLGFSVWVFFLLMALSWVLVGFYTWEKVRAQEIANLRILSVALAHSTSQSVFNVQSSLDLLADSLRNMSAGRDLNLSHRLKNYLQAQPAIQNITVMDDKGRVLSEAFRKDYPGTNSLAMQNVHYFFSKKRFLYRVFVSGYPEKALVYSIQTSRTIKKSSGGNCSCIVAFG
ncbi:PDC sensor domain-containing protein [Acidithiobacillus thiooxidans]|uniref:PDC sensor domain-containing protein n=1 Tax=Acidithiobacillus thiooxidans TaxID=930 RepID=UPI000ACCEF32|nr:PDC sensor domain-containing protein [Acidithiobacillus thiooxidans]